MLLCHNSMRANTRLVYLQVQMQAPFSSLLEESSN
jgi:hypothetical protein